MAKKPKTYIEPKAAFMTGERYEISIINTDMPLQWYYQRCGEIYKAERQSDDWFYIIDVPQDVYVPDWFKLCVHKSNVNIIK